MSSGRLIRGHRPWRSAIASAHPAATVAGQGTLAQGGNAFDAARM